ncbi:MAG: hypothetical protein PHP65_02575 [Bacilli bacterium]|jgi:homoserine kinase|nr:hypothetical protein [Bacilli bacterium]
MRLKVKVPATFGRLGWEVEGLGIAVKLYNEFYFEKSKNWIFEGFPPANDSKENLIKSAFEKTFWFAKQPAFPLKVTFIQTIPQGSGLGYQATFLVAGAIAANYFLDRRFSLVNLLNISATILNTYEGISPALFGSLCSSYQFEGEIKNMKYEVNDDLVFTHLIAKKALKKQEPFKVSIQDFSYRLTKAINLPKAFEMGDLTILRELLAYQANENQFFSNFPTNSHLKSFCIKEKYPYFINDQEGTITFVSKQPLAPLLREYALNEDWEINTLSVDKKGAFYEAIL